MKVENDYLVFPSGSRLYVHGAIVGLCAEDELRISGGWDNGIGTAAEILKDGYHKLSTDDLRELADFMIQRWKMFRDTIPHE